MTSRTLKRTSARNRTAMDPSVPRKVTPAVVSNVVATAADTIQITFGTRVFKSKLPNFTAGAGGAETVSSAQELSDTVIELTFSGTVQGTSLNVPEGDAGVRTPSGGFVPAGSYAIPSNP